MGSVRGLLAGALRGDVREMTGIPSSADTHDFAPSEPISRADLIGRRIGARLVELAVVHAAFLLVLGALWVWVFVNNDFKAPDLRNLGLLAVLLFLFLSVVYAFVWVAWVVAECSETASGHGSLGKRMFGLRIVMIDGSTPSASQAFVRLLVLWLAGMVPGPVWYQLGIFTFGLDYLVIQMVVMCFAPGAAGLHDLLVGTRVVAVEA